MAKAILVMDMPYDCTMCNSGTQTMMSAMQLEVKSFR